MVTRHAKELVRTLQREHEAILGHLEGVRREGVDTPAGRRALEAFRPMLLAHLELEDAELYPPLRAAAAGDPELSDRLDVFVGGMEAISGLARDLLDSFPERDPELPSSLANGLNHVAVFERFFAVLRRRIREEETVLYREFLRVTGVR